MIWVSTMNDQQRCRDLSLPWLCPLFMAQRSFKWKISGYPSKPTTGLKTLIFRDSYSLVFRRSILYESLFSVYFAICPWTASFDVRKLYKTINRLMKPLVGTSPCTMNAFQGYRGECFSFPWVCSLFMMQRTFRMGALRYPSKAMTNISWLLFLQTPVLSSLGGAVLLRAVLVFGLCFPLNCPLWCKKHR